MKIRKKMLIKEENEKIDLLFNRQKDINDRGVSF